MASIEQGLYTLPSCTNEKSLANQFGAFYMDKVFFFFFFFFFYSIVIQVQQ